MPYEVLGTGAQLDGLIHDLQNPLRGIQLYLDMARETMETDATSARALLTTVQERIGNIAAMLDAIHAVGQVSIQAAPSEISISTVLERTLQRTVVPSGFIIQLPDSDVRAKADPVGLALAFSEIAQNAIDHHDRAMGNLKISYETGREIRVSFADDGPGMASHVIQELGRPLLGGHKDGRGCGLARASRIIKGMGGEISAANREPRGLTLTVTLPA